MILFDFSFYSSSHETFFINNDKYFCLVLFSTTCAYHTQSSFLSQEKNLNVALPVLLWQGQDDLKAGQLLPTQLVQLNLH